MVTVKRMTLQIEERLLWKLFQFAGYNQTDMAQEQLDENSFDSQRYGSLHYRGFRRWEVISSWC